MVQDTKTESAESMSQEEEMNIDKWPKNKMQKERNSKNLEVLELLNDEKRRNKEVTKEKEVKTQKCFVCDKKLN